MATALVISQRSLCDRDQVGAVVVSAQNRIIDTGYNGPPVGFYRSTTGEVSCSAWCQRAMKRPGDPNHPGDIYANDYSDCPSLHAEANALMFSDRQLREGGTIYVSSGTCGGCAKLVANSGLARAVYVDPGMPHRNSNHWYDFLRSCGVEVTVI
jgi:dCMP deaminase